MKTLILILGLLVFSIEAWSYNKTSKYWKCYNRVRGSWSFGEAPDACTLKNFMSERLVTGKFAPFIFNDYKNIHKEKQRYTTKIHQLITEAAAKYIEKRNPRVSSKEKKAWVLAVLAKAHQESFMTHYRLGKDRKLRYMRGDFGHGHGLMQVDDRWHFPEVKSGRAANLAHNIYYAFDQYYSGWKRAPSQRCVKGATDYYNRIRATYSAYNGGPSSICRFTNPKHRWARNDVNFKNKLDQMKWEDYLKPEFRLRADLNLPCLRNDKKTNCDNTTNDSSKQPASPRLPASGEKENQVYKVGQFIELEININLRKTPGGQRIGLALKGDQFQILDVHTSGNQQHRYYKVKTFSKEGYIYAGDNQDHNRWARSIEHISSKKAALPQTGDYIYVDTKFGTNLRKTPGGRYITTVPPKTKLKILETKVKHQKYRSIFYIYVEYKGIRGYMHSGTITPKNTISKWIKEAK